MDDKIFAEEQAYLKEVLDYIEGYIDEHEGNMSSHKESIIELRRQAADIGLPSVDDAERNIELAQINDAERIESRNYLTKVEYLNKYKMMLDKPYWGRMDFVEDGESWAEEIYVGLNNVMTDDYKVYVYDWRSPIASMYYSHVTGDAKYTAPDGVIEGQITLRRQYEIVRGVLKYVYDGDRKIDDELLMDVLKNNTSVYMKNIVETIQAEQDAIIRDEDNELLMVQGVAGSGKTSIALHRIAYLLYINRNKNLTSDNVLIISPNDSFEEYISRVLPELGEKDVKYSTMERIFKREFRSHGYGIHPRVNMIEQMITNRSKRTFLRDMARFKGSKDFVKILDNLLAYYEKNIKFNDIYYNDELLFTGKELKKYFNDNEIGASIEFRTTRIENMIRKELPAKEKAYREQLEGDDSITESIHAEEIIRDKLSAAKQKVTDAIYKFRKINFAKLYRQLYTDKKVQAEVLKGVDVPENFNDIAKFTVTRLDGQGAFRYEDGMAMLYMKTKADTSIRYGNIRQVVVDEAQDYYVLQYHILKNIFSVNTQKVNYTILGDVGQTIEKPEDDSLYAEIAKVLDKKTSILIKLEKSYRSSYEISSFVKKLRNDSSDNIALDRHSDEVIVAKSNTREEMNEWLKNEIKQCEEKEFKMIAVICKNMEEVNQVYDILSPEFKVAKFKYSEQIFESQILIMPIYLAKGLEYDAVIVYDTDAENYKDETDKQLLYIAATRALHRLSFCYTGEISPYLE